MTTETQAEGIEAVRLWLGSRVGRIDRIDALAGDVSPRHYFRVTAEGESSIVARYPQELRPAQERFRHTTRLLEGAGVRVPRVFDSDLESGMDWIEDLGTDTLYDHAARADGAAARRWFESAVEILSAIQSLETSQLPRFSSLDETLS